MYLRFFAANATVVLAAKELFSTIVVEAAIVVLAPEIVVVIAIGVVPSSIALVAQE